MDINRILSLVYEIEGLLLLYRERGVEALPSSVKKLLSDKSAQVAEWLTNEKPLETKQATEEENAERLAETVEYEQEEDSAPDAGQPDAEQTLLDEAQAEEDEADTENAEIEKAREQNDTTIRKQVLAGANLLSSFTLNEKFRFAKELFGGSVTALNSIIDSISLFNDFDEVKDFLINKQGLSPDSESTKDFLAILSRNFN